MGKGMDKFLSIQRGVENLDQNGSSAFHSGATQQG